MNVKINASDEIVINYLENDLWKSKNSYDFSPIQTENKLSFFINIEEDKITNILKISSNSNNYNIQLEKEVDLNIDKISCEDIKKAINFNNCMNKNKSILKFNKCFVIPKYKSGYTNNPSNFRYLVNHSNVIKIIDRIWYQSLIDCIKNNLPDKKIYKVNLFPGFNVKVIDTAINNTFNINSTVLIDINKAFDSLEWNVLEDLLISNISRKTDPNIACSLVNYYLIILKNRKTFYNNKPITISKGIPTGLPSSPLIFTLVIEEIIFRWMNKMNFHNFIDFIINIYIDDIYIKIFDSHKAQYIIFSLIFHLQNFNLHVNMLKSKAAPNLNLSLPHLTYSDSYLGIPFTRNKKIYCNLILNEFQNKLICNWDHIYSILVNKENNYNIILGFLNYKLAPFIDFNNTNITNRELIINFIYYNFILKNIIKRIFIEFFIIFIPLYIHFNF